MSSIHQCNDGTTDITGRGTPGKIPCENNGGVVGSTPPDILGCMDPEADNYLPEATSDDGTCVFPDDYFVDDGDEGNDTETIIIGTKTAGVGNNKMIMWLIVGGIALWYLNKEGYLKKILK